MKKLLLSLAGFAIAAVPLTSVHAENINIYGWQNWSYEFVDADKGRDYDRLSNNAANIGFMSHMDTGIAGLQVGLRCEQFTYWGRLNQYTNWCNRNSKISLRHDTMGELMFGQWLLPFNEIVAQWIDPFYDAGADSHTSIMGNIGGRQSNGRGGGGLAQLFYNGSFNNSSDFTDAFGALSFNRRQEGVVQYVWPNTSDMASQSRDGFQFRVAVTEGSGTDSDITGMVLDENGDVAGASETIDPRIWSTGVSYQGPMPHGRWWVAAAYEKHEDYSISRGLSLGDRTLADDTGPVPNDVNGDPLKVYCDESDDDAFRLAGRINRDWGNGMATQIGVMWERLEYDADCSGDYTSNPYWSGVERDAWMVSGKHQFGNGMDVRFSYMDADEWDCDSDTCTDADEDETDASAYNIGLFYTMPAGTELRATYSEVRNEDNAGYDFGINGGGVVVGEDIEMFAVGIVHWFD